MMVGRYKTGRSLKGLPYALLGCGGLGWRCEPLLRVSSTDRTWLSDLIPLSSREEEHTTHLVAQSSRGSSLPRQPLRMMGNSERCGSEGKQAALRLQRRIYTRFKRDRMSCMAMASLYHRRPFRMLMIVVALVDKQWLCWTWVTEHE